MTETEILLRELVAAERARADALALALAHASSEIATLRADAEKTRIRRAKDADRKWNVRGMSADTPTLTPPAPAPSLLPPTPPNNTSSPPPTPISPPTAAAAGARAVVAIEIEQLPEEYRPDLAALLDRLSMRQDKRAWLAELRVALDGMHGPAVTPEQLGKAIRAFNANGADPTLRHFQGYLRDVVRGPPPARSNGHGTSNIAAIAYANARKGLGLDT